MEVLAVLILLFYRAIASFFRGIDCCLFRRTLDEMIPHLEMFRYDPAATLRHSPVVIRPLKRTVTLIPMIFVVMSFLHLVIAVLIFVVGNGILQLVQGESIFEDIDSIGTKVVLSIGLILYVASIPIAIFLAHLSLRGVCPGPDQDNHMNWLWKSLLLFPV